MLAFLRGFAKLNTKFETVRKEDIPYTYRSLIEGITLSTYEGYSGTMEEMRGYASELLQKAGYTEEEAEKISNRLIYEASTHNEVIDFEKAKKIGLKVKWYEEYREPWGLMREWFAKYLLEESGIHHIRYVIPTKVGGKE